MEVRAAAVLPPSITILSWRPGMCRRRLGWVARRFGVVPSWSQGGLSRSQTRAVPTAGWLRLGSDNDRGNGLSPCT